MSQYCSKYSGSRMYAVIIYFIELNNVISDVIGKKLFQNSLHLEHDTRRVEITVDLGLLHMRNMIVS